MGFGRTLYATPNQILRIHVKGLCNSNLDFQDAVRIHDVYNIVKPCVHGDMLFPSAIAHFQIKAD